MFENFAKLIIITYKYELKFSKIQLLHILDELTY